MDTTTITEAIRTDTTKTPGRLLAVWMANEGFETLDAAAEEIGISRPTLSSALADSKRLQHTTYRKIKNKTGVGGWLP